MNVLKYTNGGVRVGLTDTITFTCTACGHSADFPKAQEGKAIYCPKCQAAQVVKGKSGTDTFSAERIPTGRIAKAEAAPSTDRIAAPHGMAGTARIDFTCGACNHNARISAALGGQPVRCPACGTVQLAGVASMRVVRLDATGKLPFTCTACNYQARLNPDYAGKAIRCPKCQGAQVVPRVLREASGAHPVLPSGAAIVRTEPGTGTIRKDGTGSVRKTGTGPIAKPVAAPAVPANRSEPSPALRTPAGGIPVAQMMPMPTPLPGSLEVPPSGRQPTIAPQPEPQPEPQRGASAGQLPLVPVDTGDELDLGDGAAGVVKPDAEPKPAPAKGSVVRRSGRMAAQRTPAPGTEPTLEPARAVQPEPEPDASPAPAPATAARTKPVASTAPAPAPQVRGGPPAWLVPALGVATAVGVIASVVLLLVLQSANQRAQTLERQLDAANRQSAAAQAENGSLHDKLQASEAARAAAVAKQDEHGERIATLQRELEQAKAEIERLKSAPASPVAEPGPQ